MISWCNEQGGINGRTVVGKYYDGKITELANVMTEACTQTFMLVGEFFALPETGEQTRLGCGLPAVPGVLSGAGITHGAADGGAVPHAERPVERRNRCAPGQGLSRRR